LKNNRRRWRERPSRKSDAAIPWDLAKQVNEACDKFLKEHGVAPPPPYQPFPIKKPDKDKET